MDEENKNGTRSSIVVSPSSCIAYGMHGSLHHSLVSLFLSFSLCKSICLLKMDLNKETKKKLSEAIYFDGGEEGELNTLKNGGWLWLSLLSTHVCVCTYMAHYYYSFLKEDKRERKKEIKNV